MNTSQANTPRHSLERAVEILLGQLEHGRAPARQELPLVETDLLSWLEAQSASTKLYWQSRDSEFELAGIGIADDRASAEELQMTIPAVRYIGGLRFDPTYPRLSPEWEQFGAGRFICPLIEIRRVGRDYRLALNLLRDSLLGDTRQLLRHPATASRRSPSVGMTVMARPTGTERSDFLQSVAQALDLIDRTQVSKIVLARTLQLAFNEKISPWGLLANWRGHSNRCFLFGLQTPEGDAFVSATPERLYQRCGRSVRTEAVAGTRPRGMSREEDERLGHELLNSDKDRREHRWVQDAVAESLRAIAPNLTFAPTELMKLPRLQHLVATAEGTVRADVHDHQLLELLPPTPAVAGFPRAAALEGIRQLEWIDRGWYAGPIGWIGSDEAEFAVGIRSCLVRGRGLTAYAGVGIVEGSIPETEWQETEQKLASFIGQVTIL